MAGTHLLLLLFLRGRKRSRSRSRSPGSNGRRLRRRLRRQSSSVKKIPDTFQIFFTAVGKQDVKAFLMKISVKDLELLGEVDHWNIIPHFHISPPENNRFCRFPLDFEYLATIPGGVPYGNAVVVGSTVYAMFTAVDRKKFLALNLDSKGNLNWTEMPHPPCDISIKEPKLISICGLIFLLGGDPFGAILDPQTYSWSLLQQPFGTKLEATNIVFFSSLGEANGKILVYSSSSRIYIYDVQTSIWVSYLCEGGIGISHLRFPEVGNPVFNEENLYWINSKGFIFAFDWEGKRLSSGPLLGMEPDCLHDMLSHNFSLFHLLGDLFCLLWGVLKREYHRDWEYTRYHASFIRVIKDESSCASLTAFVVGCYEYVIDGHYKPYDAFVVSGADPKGV